MIIDSHCHLDFESLYDQLDEVVNRAKKVNVEYLLTICTTLESYKKIEIILNNYKNIYGTFGIHPHETKNFLEVDTNYIVNIKNKNKKVIGIGETGLDYFYNHSDKSIQKKSFINHINAATKLDLPVIVHSRNAESDTLDIIENERKNSNTKISL